MVWRLMPVIVGNVLLIAAGVAYGVRTDRWSAGETRSHAQARLAVVPDEIAGFASRDVEIDPRHLQITGAFAALSRIYADPATGKKLEMILLHGRPGLLAAHTPDVCLAGSGFEMEGEPTQLPISTQTGGSAAVWSALFRKGGSDPRRVRVAWGWGEKGVWTAPKNARLAFATRKTLWKLYLLEPLPAIGGTGDDELVKRFADQMRGVLQP